MAGVSSAVLALALSTVSLSAKPLPIIIDTDIGDSFDDVWAIAEAISRPDKWDVRMILTAHNDTTARAQIVAKYLTRWGRTDIPIGIGVHTNNHTGSLYPWASDVDLQAYNASSIGKVYPDGVRRAVGLLTASPGKISMVAIAPMTNFGAITQHYPEAVGAVRRIYGMFGGLDRCYHNATIDTPGSCKEGNVGSNVTASQEMVNVSWPMTITPLDTCMVAMSGEPWKRMQAANNTDHPLVHTLLESIEVWRPGSSTAEYSDAIFDAVTIFMSDSLSRFNMQDLRISVTDKGGGIKRDPNGKLMSVALTWNYSQGGYEGFFQDLAANLIAWSPSVVV